MKNNKLNKSIIVILILILLFDIIIFYLMYIECSLTRYYGITDESFDKMSNIIIFHICSDILFLILFLIYIYIGNKKK